MPNGEIKNKLDGIYERGEGEMRKDRPARVLHVVGAMNRAGTESMLMNIYRNINHHKIKFDFVSYEDEEADFDEEIEFLGGRIFTLSKSNSIKQLYDVMKNHGPYDVVHAHTLFHCGIACLAAFLARIKVRIAHAHTTADHSHQLLRKLYIFMMRFLIYLFATQKLACSGEAGSYLFGKKSLSKQNYSHFPNVIDYKNYHDVPEKDIEKFKCSVGIKKDNIVIGHIGTFKASKNQQFLLKIMENLIEINRHMILLLIGDGELKDPIQNLVRQKNLTEHVKILGKREDIPTILHSLDVFLFPSLYEGLGMVLLEAQASGIPCIVSEAIQPEADLGIGLVERVPLNESLVWVEKIIQNTGQRDNNPDKIEIAFDKSGYSLTNGIKTIQQIYRLA